MHPFPTVVLGQRRPLVPSIDDIALPMSMDYQHQPLSSSSRHRRTNGECLTPVTAVEWILADGCFGPVTCRSLYVFLFDLSRMTRNVLTAVSKKTLGSADQNR